MEAKKWIAVTGKLEFVNDWEKTPSGGVFSLDWQLTLSLLLKESEKLSHNGLGLVLGDIVATGVDLYGTDV